MRFALVDAATTTDLRRAVLRPTWAPGTPMPGDEDPDALHVAAVIDGGTDRTNRTLGACVLFRERCPHHADVEGAWQLRGMATADGHRGEGIGAAVLATAIETVRSRGAALLWCKARVTAAAFYAAHGFAVDGDDYVEPETGLAHRDMSHPLATQATQTTQTQ